MSKRPGTSSGRLTADTALVARPCLLKSVILEGDGTNAASLIIYDNASAASGTVLCKLLLPAGTAGAGLPCIIWQHADGVEANKGLYADVTGTGAAFIVHYSEM